MQNLAQETTSSQMRKLRRARVPVLLALFFATSLILRVPIVQVCSTEAQGEVLLAESPLVTRGVTEDLPADASSSGENQAQKSGIETHGANKPLDKSTAPSPTVAKSAVPPSDFVSPAVAASPSIEAERSELATHDGSESLVSTADQALLEDVRIAQVTSQDESDASEQSGSSAAEQGETVEHHLVSTDVDPEVEVSGSRDYLTSQEETTIRDLKRLIQGTTQIVILIQDGLSDQSTEVE